MIRYASLGVFAVGILLVVFGLTKILPGIESGGGSLAFFGLVLFGLSFIPQPQNEENVKPMSAIERLTAIFYSPAEVFQNLRRNPLWLVPLLLIALISSIYTFAFVARLTPEKIVSHTVGKLEQAGFITPEIAAKQKVDQLKEFTEPIRQIGGAISNFAWTFIGMAFLAAIYLVVVLAFGGQINFWQALASTIHSAFPIILLQKGLSLLILFLKEPADIHPVLGQGSLVQDNLGFLFNPAENAIFYVLASSFSLLTIYGLWLGATGLKNAGERVSVSASWTAVITVFLILVTLSVSITAMFPGMIG